MPTHALHTHVSQSVHGVCVNVYTRDENGSCAGLNARSRAYHKCIYVVATTQSQAYRRHTDNKKHQPAASRQSKRIHRRHARLGNAHQPLCLCFISEIYDCLRRSDNYYGERAWPRKRDMRARLGGCVLFAGLHDKQHTGHRHTNQGRITSGCQRHDQHGDEQKINKHTHTHSTCRHSQLESTPFGVPLRYCLCEYNHTIKYA